MPSEPTYDRHLDDLTGELFTAVADLRAQVNAHVPARAIKLKIGVIRDIADHLYSAIEDSRPGNNLIIRQGRSPDS